MDYLMQLPVTETGTAAGSSAGTTSTLTTANTVQFSIRGKAYSKAGAANAATPTTDHTTGNAFVALAASQGCALVFSYDAAGTLRMSQGGVQALDASGNFIIAPQFPMVPATDCPFAYAILKNGSTGTAFTPGTSSWNQAGMTATFVDIWCLPDRPQVS